MSDRLNGKNMPIQMLLMRSGHLLKYQMFSLLEQYDMNPGQVGVLFILERYGNLSQRQLARIAGISPPSMTVALRKMEEKGLIGRTPDADDQRKIRIDLTDAGRARIGDMRQLLQQDAGAHAGRLLRGGKAPSAPVPPADRGQHPAFGGYGRGRSVRDLPPHAPEK